MFVIINIMLKFKNESNTVKSYWIVTFFLLLFYIYFLNSAIHIVII